MPEHKHSWTEHSRTFTIVRFYCECGQYGYRHILKSHQQLKIYVKAPKPLLTSAEITAQPRRNGRNSTGGYLPPGGS